MSFVTLGVIVEVAFCLLEEHSGRYHDNDSLHGVGFSILVNKGPLCRAEEADNYVTMAPHEGKKLHKRFYVRALSKYRDVHQL